MSACGRTASACSIDPVRLEALVNVEDAAIRDGLSGRDEPGDDGAAAPTAPAHQHTLGQGVDQGGGEPQATHATGGAEPDAETAAEAAEEAAAHLANVALVMQWVQVRPQCSPLQPGSGLSQPSPNQPDPCEAALTRTRASPNACEANLRAPQGEPNARPRAGLTRARLT